MSKSRSASPRHGVHAKFAASERHNERFFEERRKREAANLARSLELKALRLAKEAREKAGAQSAEPSRKKPPQAS
jgi:hypothetical protein